jgi:hypothetical protein
MENEERPAHLRHCGCRSRRGEAIERAMPLLALSVREAGARRRRSVAVGPSSQRTAPVFGEPNSGLRARRRNANSETRHLRHARRSGIIYFVADADGWIRCREPPAIPALLGAKKPPLPRFHTDHVHSSINVRRSAKTPRSSVSGEPAYVEDRPASAAGKLRPAA